MVDRRACILSCVVLSMLACSTPVWARQLRGDAVSVAISSGGRASSTSTAGNDADVTTTTVATKGGTAVASQEHTHGSHSLTKVAIGNKTTTVEHHAVSWEEAPTCPFAPTATNSHNDTLGRLWGWSSHTSCAFRQAVKDLWDTAPVCPPNTPRSTLKLDDSNRWWGWHDNASCAVKEPLADEAGDKDRDNQSAHRSLLGSAVAQSIARATQDTQNAALAEAVAVGGADASALAVANGGQSVSQAVATASVDINDPAQLVNTLGCSCDKAAPAARTIAEAISTSGCGGTALARAFAQATVAQAAAMSQALSDGGAPQCIPDSNPQNSPSPNPPRLPSPSNSPPVFLSPSPSARSLPSPSPSTTSPPPASPTAPQDPVSVITGNPEEPESVRLLKDLCCRCPRATIAAAAVATAVAKQGCNGEAAHTLAEAFAMADREQAVAMSTALSTHSATFERCLPPTVPSPIPTPAPQSPPTPAPQPSPSPTPVPQPSPTPTPVPQPSPSPTPVPQPSPSPTPAPQPLPSTTPAPQSSPSPVPQLHTQPGPSSPTPEYASWKFGFTGHSDDSTTTTTNKVQTPTQPAQQPSTDHTAVTTGEWDTAPSCSPNTQPSTYDASGRPWSWQDGRSCACRDKVSTQPSSQPVQQPSTDHTAVVTGDWETAPSCSPSTQPSTFDASGRPWSWQDGQSCACKDKVGTQPSPQPAQQPSTDHTAVATGDWDTAPSCSPNTQPSTFDASGRPWSWQDGRSCACKDKVGTQTAPQPMQQSFTDHTAVTTGDWDTAPSCNPNTQPSTFDVSGRPWSWQDGRSCACKDHPSVTGRTTAVPPGDWTTAPSCSASITQAALIDVNGKPWGFQGGQPCACRHMQQPDLSGYATGSQDSSSTGASETSTPSQPTWETAVTCPAGVQPTVFDVNGKAWGWNAAEGRSCACRDEPSQTPPQQSPTQPPQQSPTQPPQQSPTQSPQQPPTQPSQQPASHDDTAIISGGLDDTQKPVSSPAVSSPSVNPPVTWQTAPSCQPGTTPTVYDSAGLPWAWDSHAVRMCSCRDAPKKKPAASPAGFDTTPASPSPTASTPSPSPSPHPVSPSPAPTASPKPVTPPFPAPAAPAVTSPPRTSQAVAQAVSTGGSAVAQAVSTGGLAVAQAQSYAFHPLQLSQDLTCNCDRAKTAAAALEKEVAAKGCGCDAGQVLASAFSQAVGGQATAMSQALAEGAPAAQKCLQKQS